MKIFLMISLILFIGSGFASFFTQENLLKITEACRTNWPLIFILWGFKYLQVRDPKNV